MYRTEPRHGLLAGPQPKEPQLIDRATFLPIGQYADGSLTFAWPGFLKDAWEGGKRSYHQGFQLPAVNEAGNYAGTPKAGTCRSSMASTTRMIFKSLNRISD